MVGYSICIHQNKILTHLSSSQKHNSLKNLKTIKGPYSGPRSWALTQWPWSFQQYISPGFFMTPSQSFAEHVPTWSYWRIPQTKKQYLQGPKYSSWIHKNQGPKKCITIPQNDNTSKCITIWHTCNKPPKIDHAKIFIFSLLIFWYLAYCSVNPWGTCFTWSRPCWVGFQFNQESSWLLRYR